MTTSNFVPAHKIFFLDAKLKNLLDESDPRGFCERYFSELLQAIKMDPLAPMSVSPAADLSAPGFSGIQELTTSHTSFHYFWEPQIEGGNPNIHIDLYSCADFSYEDVLRVAHKHFAFAEWTGNFVERSIDPSTRMTLLLQGKGNQVIESAALNAKNHEGIFAETITIS